MADVSQFCLWAATLLVALAAIAHVGAMFARSGGHAVRRTPAPVEDVDALVAAPAGAGRSMGGGSVSAALLEDDERNESAPPIAPSRSGRGLVWYGMRFAQLGLVALTVALVSRAIATGHGPFTNQHEFAVSFAWGMLAAYAYFEWRHEVHALAVLVMPVTLAMLAYSLTVDSTIQPLVPALQNRALLTLHVATAVLAYGAAAVGAAAGVLYLLRPRLSWRALPDREALDEIGYRAIVFSYPLMTVMIILGAIWADIAWGKYWSWDPKETAALVTWLVYGAYLHARVAREWRGTRAAWLLLLGFVAILFTFFGNLFFGGLHAYA